MIAQPISKQAAKVVTSLTELSTVVAVYLSRPGEEIYLDTETTGLSPRENKLSAVILKQGNRTPVIVDVRFEPELLLPELRPIVNASLVVGHNLKFDGEFLLANGVALGDIFDTMIAEQVLLGGSDEDESVDLKSVSFRYGIRNVSKEERSWFIDLDKRPDEWNAPFPETQIEYMAQDVDVLPTIYQEQRKKLLKFGLSEVFQIEMKALPVIARMELHGITVDLEGWRAFIDDKKVEARGYEEKVLEVFGAAILKERIERYDGALREWHAAQDAEAKFIEQAHTSWEGHQKGSGGPWAALKADQFYAMPLKPEEYSLPWGEYKKLALSNWRKEHPMPSKPKLDTSPPNIGSGDQLITAFRVLGIPVPTKKNAKGQIVPTTESEALEKLSKDYPAVTPILDFRKAQKFVDSFGESLLSKGFETGLSFFDDDGNEHHLLSIHSDYQQLVSTGRMSCRKPNFQQIPSRGDGKRVRKLVRARPGHKLLTADLSNAEMRILAFHVGPGALYDALVSGKDLHTETAKLMFGLPAEWGKEETEAAEFRPGVSYRQVAKVINFGLVYGMSAFKLSRDFGFTLEEAETLLNRYFMAYPEVKKWLERQAKEVHRNLYSRTLAGRWRRYTAPQQPIPPGRGSRADYAAHRDKVRAYEKAWAAIERKAKNHPIQGSNADIIKLALGYLGERMEPDVGVAVAVVHDEIVVEAPDAMAEYAERVLAWAMEDAFRFYVDPALVPPTEVKVKDYWSK